MKNIYFAGSIRGGRQDAELYARMIARIGEKHRVLTEHVGCLSLTEMGEEGKSDQEIYQQDTAWLREADLVIAECSTPSLGVGYELAYAEALGKPVYLFYNSARGGLSAMLSGNRYFQLRPYTTQEQLFAGLDALL